MEEQPELPAQLVANAQFVRDGLRQAGFNVIDGESAIVPVLIGDDHKAFALWTGLFNAGIFVNVFIAPATPPGMAMMRNSFMATHRREHLEKIVDVYTSVGKQAGII